MQKMTGVSVQCHGACHAKFIAPKKWIVAGLANGDIHVYGYDPMNRIHVLREHSSEITALAVHPTEPYMLSTCSTGKIVLWDYGKDVWLVKRTLKAKTDAYPAAFGPKDSDIFVYTDNLRRVIQIRNLHSGECMVELPGHSKYSMCFDYFSHGDELYMFTGSGDNTAKVWNCVTGACLGTLYCTDKVLTVCCHPDLPLLITGSEDGCVCLWNSTNFRLERVFNYRKGSVLAVACLKGTTRIAIGHSEQLVVADIAPEGTMCLIRQ